MVLKQAFKSWTIEMLYTRVSKNFFFHMAPVKETQKKAVARRKISQKTTT